MGGAWILEVGILAPLVLLVKEQARGKRLAIFLEADTQRESQRPLHHHFVDPNPRKKQTPKSVPTSLLLASPPAFVSAPRRLRRRGRSRRQRLRQRPRSRAAETCRRPVLGGTAKRRPSFQGGFDSKERCPKLLGIPKGFPLLVRELKRGLPKHGRIRISGRSRVCVYKMAGLKATPKRRPNHFGGCSMRQTHLCVLWSVPFGVA